MCIYNYFVITLIYLCVYIIILLLPLFLMCIYNYFVITLTYLCVYIIILLLPLLTYVYI